MRLILLERKKYEAMLALWKSIFSTLSSKISHALQGRLKRPLALLKHSTLKQVRIVSK